jgi:hypothetical protein
MVTTSGDLNHLQNIPIDCACVIHGTGYKWQYVDKLYNMLTRNLTREVRLHVYTETERVVPAPYIKHELVDWGISGARKSWWYKLQLFNPNNFAGPLMYFDLDTVIVDNIDWIWQLPLRYFWTLQDFKYLWRSTHQGINSSIMWWDTRNFAYIFKNFNVKNLSFTLKQYPGDQDYLTREIDNKYLRFMPQNRISSWRWQCLDGGYNFKQRIYYQPGTGTQINKDTSVLIFHGSPKPHQVTDSIIEQHWK